MHHATTTRGARAVAVFDVAVITARCAETRSTRVGSPHFYTERKTWQNDLVLPGLGDNWIVGTRKPNGSIKRLKSPSLPPCLLKGECQAALDRYVIWTKGNSWPVVEDTDVAKTAVAKRKAKEPGESPFDYEDLAPKDVAKCEQAVEKIAGYQRRMAGDIVSIGKELLAVKERLPHGSFYAWIEHYFQWSRPTATRMMQAAETFKSFNLNALTIDQSALYLLSSDKCPDEIREEVVQRAEQGERITHASVKQALHDLVTDDDEPVSPRRKTTTAKAYEEDDEEAVCPHPPKLVHSDDWSLGDFVTAMHREVGIWRERCPEDQLEEMAEVLRDMAEQIEEQCKA